MTQVTKAMGEIPRALSQIYYCIDGHEKGDKGVRKKCKGGRRERRGGEGRKKVGCGVSKKRMKLGACGRRKGRL
jgi:hypothetical protein